MGEKEKQPIVKKVNLRRWGDSATFPDMYIRFKPYKSNPNRYHSYYHHYWDDHAREAHFYNKDGVQVILDNDGTKINSINTRLDKGMLELIGRGNLTQFKKH